MLTNRDKKILLWIENFNVITIEQARVMFFDGSYDNARRRLRVLEQQGILNSYIIKDTKEKAYYIDKKMSQHDIYILDFIKKITELGCNVEKVNLKPHYLNNTLIPDAFIEFSFNGDLYLVLLEVDYRHGTEMLKFKSLYERLYSERAKHKEFLGTFPFVVVANMKATIRYSSVNFNTIYTDLSYSNLKEILLQQ